MVIKLKQCQIFRSYRLSVLSNELHQTACSDGRLNITFIPLAVKTHFEVYNVNYSMSTQSRLPVVYSQIL